ncbi:MAG: hypothetical protein GXP55_17385 [Deltaproteobacteria bacterium]|nr:hypothetical protein [Deltaproteobacteria bacterium]
MSVATTAGLELRATARRRRHVRLVGSAGSQRHRERAHFTRGKRQRGIALVVAITTIAILSAMLAEMHEATSTAFAVSMAERDRLQAEYMADSGLDLTRLLVAAEPRIRQLVGPMYQMLIGRPPPMLPVWNLADSILSPFCHRPGMARVTLNEDGSRNTEDGDDSEDSGFGFDAFSSAEGLEDLPGTCTIVSVAENSKININDPLYLDGDRARRSIAMQLFALIGGYQSPSPYDPLFEGEDADGQYTSRLDIVSDILDWWDPDTERSSFDPGAGTVTSAGAEDDIYQRLDDPYKVKNAPFDSLEEMRLVRGVGDDFWATFVEPRPHDPTSRILTIYGSGAVNPNEAPPAVLLARVCSFVNNQPLCTNPAEGAKFIQLLSTVRAMIPIPFFTRSADFLTFLEGRGGPQDLYPMLVGYLGPDSLLLFQPITVPAAKRRDMQGSFVTGARIIDVQVTGQVGRSSVTLDAILNFHDRWTPPPPNAGRMPGLGIFHHFRID